MPSRRLPAFQHGTQSIRLPQQQRRAELAEIERFARERGIDKVPEAERDDRLGMAGSIWHNPLRGGRAWK
jgi:hypothetical protein